MKFGKNIPKNRTVWIENSHGSEVKDSPFDINPYKSRASGFNAPNINMNPTDNSCMLRQFVSFGGRFSFIGHFR